MKNVEIKLDTGEEGVNDWMPSSSTDSTKLLKVYVT